MSEGFAADYPGARLRFSPNWGERRGTASPDIILLHYTGMESGAHAEDRLCDAGSEVSCHYLVHEDGAVAQMVAEANRAWHAGASSWTGSGDLNSRSIGIEIVNRGHGLGYPDFPPRQIEAVIALCRSIMARHAIPAHRVLAHSDVAPGRKLDPGEKFPWARLAEAGAAFHVPAVDGEEPELQAGDQGRAVVALQEDLARIGYGIEANGVFDDRTVAVVAAFQRRFRQALVSGEADRGTLLTIQRVLAALP